MDGLHLQFERTVEEVDKFGWNEGLYIVGQGH